MDALQKVNEDVNTLFNITDILTLHLRHQQIYTYAHTILAYLRDFFKYETSCHTHNGLHQHQCSYIQHIITPYTLSRT